MSHDRKTPRRTVSPAVWIGFLGIAALEVLAQVHGDDFEFFENRIRPVLVERCYKCHSAASEKLKGALQLDSRAGMLKGGESGQPAIVPGDAERSRLIEAIRYQNEDLRMPPKQKLPDQAVADFVNWINLGAPDPRTNQIVPTTPVRTTGPLSVANHWAFVPPADPPVPKVKLESWPQTPIDCFIAARLEGKNLRPSAPADKRTLLRRATYDLTGLPPTAAEVDAFLRDQSPLAFKRVVDRLLASPHYGERWGRYWLDIARYSDTKGYVYDREEKRLVHSAAYRDWVVRALNEDLPYDQFLLFQIAADQLCGENGADPRSLAAMGFLTVGRRFLGVQHDIIDDRIDVVTRGTMGLTVACARCHDHKFDPIPTRDYYSLYGVFYNSSELTVPTVPHPEATKAYEAYVKGLGEREGKLAKTFQAKRAELAERLRAKTTDYLVAVLDVAKLPSEEFYSFIGPEDLNPVIVRQWEAYLFKVRTRNDPVFALWHAYAALPRNEFASLTPTVHAQFAAEGDRARTINPLVLRSFADSAPGSMRDVAERYGKLFAGVNQAWSEAVKAAAASNTAPPLALDRDQEPLRQVLYGPDSPASVPNGAVVDIEWFFDENTRVELAKLQLAIDQWIIDSPGAPPHAGILADRPAPKNTRVFLRGNPANKGEEVPRQFLQVAAGPGRRPFEQGSGRLELARAIVNPENPLTARVFVNRVWLHHFGAGLVRTPSDFGTRSEPPSHPELLDWLARGFVADGWSIKKLHRLIMLSSVYQQDSVESATLASSARPASQIDPENRLLWRMNPQRLDFESMRDSLLSVSGELDEKIGGRPADLFKSPFSTRRTIYGYIDRQFVPGVLRVFDFANPDLHIPQRSETTVPQQALFFMNSPFVVERARALIARPAVQASPRPADRIQQLYRLVYQRSATPRQVEAGLNFLALAQAEPPPGAPKPVITAWQYGFGAFDEATQRMTNFQRLPHFTGDAWQGGPNWPDDKLGWVQLTAEGGHAGNDLAHAAVRRWTAPRDGMVSISGTVRHEYEAGDGIVARLVSNRAGLLGMWTLHNTNANAKVESVEVKQGDTIDFVVDFRANLNSDMFKWSPVIRLKESAPGSADEVREWDARKGFGGTPPPPPRPLDAWEKYAQVLLQSNEFLFVD